MNEQGKSKQWVLNPSRILSPEEVSKLRRFASERAELHKAQGKRQGLRDWMIVDIAMSAGLRVSSIQKLRIADLHILYSDSSIFVRQGKGNKQRNVIIDKKLRRHLKEYLKLKKLWGESLDQEAHLLISERKAPYSIGGLQDRWKVVCKLAGLPSHYSIHCGRHVFCTTVYRNTKDLRLTQLQAGHSSPVVTQVYTHLLDEEVKKGMDNLYGE